MSEQKRIITQDEIAKFMEGKDPQERIVNLEYSYQDPFIQVFYRDEQDRKCVEKQPFYPIVWATYDACDKLCGGDRAVTKALMIKHCIGVKALSNRNIDGEQCHDFDNGYRFMFYAEKPMSYSNFLKFFRLAGNPVYKKEDSEKKAGNRDGNRQYMTVRPEAQFLITTGKRFFKGYTDYDQLLRMTFDLETEGLDPTRHRIKLNGVKLNRDVTINGRTYHNWGHIFKLEGETEEEKNASELKMIDMFLRLIYTFKPDIITAHNGENFDWNFIIKRCEMLGTSIEDMSKPYFGEKVFIHKETKESILKLGGEVETFYKTIVPNTTVTDSLHAVRRAQATNSSIKKADLKYISKFLGIKKDNRVYTPGQDIDKILSDKINKYAFNDTDGDWYLYDEASPNGRDIEFKKGKNGDKPFIMYKRNYLADGYKIVTGEYIIDRYLLDDVWECDRVEYSYNGTDFMLAKIIPETFSKCTTMGTAGQWKAIMLAWSYENGLAIPLAANTGAFTGGLSRLLRVGYVKNIVKLDYNSLYPSIILTWGISDSTDLMQAMLHMLEYVLTSRERYKGLKKAAEKIVDKYEEELNQGIKLLKEMLAEYETAKNDFKVNDNNQAVVKKLGNSFFGSYGSNNGAVFPWKSKKCAEQTTCTGRQCLRLMISHFHNLGYEPIVGDSVTGDTPLFIRYKDSGYIDIKPIEELMDGSTIETDYLGRKYDTSVKPYQVLCRNGWQDIEYVYSHDTDKDIYEVSDGKSTVECTQDHSLFDSNLNEIKPTEITHDTKLEYYNGDIEHTVLSVSFSDDIIKEQAKQLANGIIDRVPYTILNAGIEKRIIFYKEFIKYQDVKRLYSKTCIAGVRFLVKK